MLAASPKKTTKGKYGGGGKTVRQPPGWGIVHLRRSSLSCGSWGNRTLTGRSRFGNRRHGKLAFEGDGWRAGGESGSDAEGVGALRAPEFRLEGLRS